MEIDKVMNENQLDAIISPTDSPAWSIDLIDGDHFSGKLIACGHGRLSAHHRSGRNDLWIAGRISFMGGME